MANSQEHSDDAERLRLRQADEKRVDWRHWGPYLSERGWASVREDYSANGDAWNYFGYDMARSRAYRWNEDGMGGICDLEQTLCLALTFWNGHDAHLKERCFGLTNSQGNHGEDAKDYWWYLDSTPTHSWMRWRYHYPQAAFPYADLIAENARRGRDQPEYELVDTGIFAEGRYFEITADYAKATAEDMRIEIRIVNRGPDEASIDVLPTLWFRNTWGWGDGHPVPALSCAAGSIIAAHPRLGLRRLTSDTDATALFCDNETNRERLYGATPSPPYPKDGINDYLIHGAASVNPAMTGTKAALHHHLVIAAGATATLRLQFTDQMGSSADDTVAVLATRATEANRFYAALTPADASVDEASVMRQAFAGMLWGKQFFHYDVERWLDGDPGQPAPSLGRGAIRNGNWPHVNALDVLSMPDAWEYPWFASWDLGFHSVALAHVDAAFAKRQLLLLCREWYMHPNGQLPAYEWSFDDVNPPVHAWAAMRVFEIDGRRDLGFLERVFHKLLINFTWWVNRKDAEGNNVFQGGFLGLDNIGIFNRSTLPPGIGQLEQSDGTAWMAMYCLDMLEIALALAHHDSTYEDVATKFFEHFAYIATAMDNQGLWDEQDGFYYDVLHLAGGDRVPIRAHSIVGLISLCGITVLEEQVARTVPEFMRRMDWFLAHKPNYARVIGHIHDAGSDDAGWLLSIVDPARLRRVLARALDEGELLSDHGLRALSRYHLEHPLVLQLNGVEARLDYEPGESTTALFGGNSNWRGPVWFPVNLLVIDALRRYHRYLGDSYTVPLPTQNGTERSLEAVADELSRRLISLFLDDKSGRRPVFGSCQLFQEDPHWHDCIPFHEYFHGEDGRGLGASHQTGWTGLVAHLIASRATVASTVASP